MYGEELIGRSPMRAVAASIRGGLEAGQTGGVLARAGVGKTAFLVHVALHNLLRGVPVLHISLTDGQARVRSLYDEIFTEIGREAPVLERAAAQLSIERHRVIHACLGRAFGPAELGALLGTLADVMGFRPTVVVLDGQDVATYDGAAWGALAAERSIRIWVGLRIHREHHDQVEALAQRFDTAVYLEPKGTDIALRLLRAGGRAAVTAEELHLDPVSMLLRPEDAQDSITKPPSPHPSGCTLFSGGAQGAEATFGELAQKFGIKEVNFTFEGHTQAREVGVRVLDPRELSAGDVSLVYVAHRLHRHWDKTEMLRKVLQTQWHVVSNAAQVFVIGTIQADGTVHGGTGWSVELARRWNKRVWVFDQEKASWFVWRNEAWMKGEPVVESADFAGTGTRFLNDAGKQAIIDLFTRSFGE
jgi:hypothetical protein